MVISSDLTEKRLDMDHYTVYFITYWTFTWSILEITAKTLPEEPIMKFTKKIKNGIKWLVPYGIIIHKRKKVQKSLSEQRSQKENEIKNYFLSLNTTTDDPEVIEIIDYFKKYKFSIFPYDFSRKYLMRDIDVLFDTTIKMRYVIHENKRLYFPEDWETEAICSYYNGLCIEQDKDSPHRYETDGYIVQEGDIIADIGAAEGIWALSAVEKAGKIYLFECDQMWIKTLKKTFEPWKEKIVIVDKYVSNINDKQNVTLDSFFGKNRIDFIKADIEGMEIKLLEGGKEILANNSNLKLLLCAYHRKNDETEIKKILDRNGFKTEYSKRYMLFIYDNELEKPYMRRGLVRAMKN